MQTINITSSRWPVVQGRDEDPESEVKPVAEDCCGLAPPSRGASSACLLPNLLAKNTHPTNSARLARWSSQKRLGGLSGSVRRRSNDHAETAPGSSTMGSSQKASRRLSCPKSDVAGKPNTVLLRKAHRANRIAMAYRPMAGSICPRSSNHWPPIAPTIATMPQKTLARTVLAEPKAAKCSGGTGTVVAVALLPAAAASKPTVTDGLEARNCLTRSQRAETRKLAAARLN